MPHSTINFPLEEKVFGFAHDLSSRQAGDPIAFLMLINDAGEVLSTQFRDQDPANRCLSNREALKVNLQERERSLFYDPFDWPEYAWIGWKEIDRFAMERIIGTAFQESDLVSQSGATMTFPRTWSFMR